MIAGLGAGLLLAIAVGVLLAFRATLRLYAEVAARGEADDDDAASKVGVRVKGERTKEAAYKAMALKQRTEAILRESAPLAVGAYDAAEVIRRRKDEAAMIARMGAWSKEGAGKRDAALGLDSADAARDPLADTAEEEKEWQ